MNYSTRRSLGTSTVALILCFAMLLGTTFAWFTDTASSEGNVIQTGSLKVGLHLLEKDGSWRSIKEDPNPIYSEGILWEPGYTDVKILKVSNDGSLALKWKAKFVSDVELSDLAEVIDVYVNPSIGNTYPDSRELDASWQHVGTLDQFVGTLSETTYGFLETGESANLGLALKMQESANNDYQDKTLGEFTIQILATQASYENDSFGDDYDKDAIFSDELNFATTASLANVETINNELVNDLVIRYNDEIYAELSAGTKLVAGVSSLKFSGKPVEEANSNIVLGEDDNAKNYDIHIEGIHENNTKPIKVYLGKVLEKGLTNTELKLYHEGTQMTPVNSVEDLVVNNQFYYNAQTGEVVLSVNNFSVFTAVKTSADVWDGASNTSWYNESATEFTLTTAEQFAGFRDLVDAGNSFTGKTVKLGADIDLNGKLFDPIGFGYTYGKDSTTAFMGTFDGGNHTIYNLYQNGWDLDPDKTNYSTYTYSTAGAGLFASIENATIKNLVVSGADIVFECVDMGIVVGYAQGNCHFENIVITDSKIANYNRYTGGVVGEISYGSYGTDVTKGYSHTFKNIVVDSSVVVSSLWGSFDTSIGGVIGGKWGDATVKMENVTVACELDVFSDVTSAYQWYAYRRCGMIIGYTEQNSPKSALNAGAPFLTCEDVRVFYGDWVNYNYYEFANQDSTTGQRYPWVRAEASPVGNNGAFSNPRYGVPTHGGVKVTEDPNMGTLKTGYAAITFNQLYGGGQGVYGKADHDGVKIHHLNPEATKTIYFQNTNGWDNLKLMYIYKTPFNGDTWTTVVEGISLGEAVDAQGKYAIYKVTVPADAYAFTIIGDSEGETTPEIVMSSLADEHLYYVNEDDEIKHCKYIDGYKTVYFENNKGWTDVYLYYWCNDGKDDWGTMDFPGEKMTLVSSEGVYKVYSFVIPAYATGFVFSDGKENVTGTEHYQSVDVKLTSDPDGKIFYLGSIDNNQVVDGNKVNYKYSVNSTKYVAGYKTFTFANNWSWSDIKVHYWTVSGTSASDHTVYPGVALSQNSDGLYKVNIPNYASKFMLSGVNPDGSNSPREKTKDISLSEFDGSKIYGLKYTSTGKTNNALEIETFRVLYLKPNSNWTQSSAWFAARVWTTSSSDAWFKMTSIGSGIYRCYVPESYKYVIFVRLNPASTNMNWDNKWNQTGDLTIPSDGKNLFTVPNGAWDGSTSGWSKK